MKIVLPSLGAKARQRMGHGIVWSGVSMNPKHNRKWSSTAVYPVLPLRTEKSLSPKG